MVKHPFGRLNTGGVGIPRGGLNPTYFSPDFVLNTSLLSSSIYTLSSLVPFGNDFLLDVLLLSEECIRADQSGLVNTYYTSDWPMYHTPNPHDIGVFYLRKFVRIREMRENGRRESTKRVRRRANVREAVETTFLHVFPSRKRQRTPIPERDATKYRVFSSLI